MTTAQQGRAARPVVLGEALYRQLVATLPQSAVYLYDTDLTFVLADGEAMREVGLAPEAVIGKRLPDIVSAESLALLEPAYRAALRGESVELRHPGEEGTHWYRVRLRPVRAEDGEVIGGLVVTDDITAELAAEVALAESRASWQRLFDQAPIGMYLAEPGPTGRLLAVNAALCALLELTRAQLLAARKVDLVAPDDPEGYLEQATRLATEGRVAMAERRLVLRDGSTRWLRFSASLVEDPGGQRTLGQFVDITETKAVEERLREALAFQDAVLSVSPDPVRVVDVDQGSHVWTSKALGWQLGYTDEQLQQLDPDGRALVHPDDLPLLADSVRRLVDVPDGQVVRVRHRALAADGSVRWLDRLKTPFRRRPDGALAQYVSVVRDVTEEVRAQDQRAEDLAFREAVLSTSPDLVSVFELAAGRTVWASRHLPDLLGYDLVKVQALQSRGLDGLVHPDDLAAFHAELAALADAADGSVLTGETRVRGADGRWWTLARRSTPFRRDATGRVTHVLTSSRDVTAEVESAQELERVRGFQQAVIATSPDAVLLLDAATSRPVWASRDLRGVLGWSADELIARAERPLDALVLPEDLPAVQERERAVLAAPDGAVVHARFRARHRDGSTRWLSRRMTPFARAADGTVEQVLATVRDVTDVVEAEGRLQRAALHDSLTGLPNRRLLSDRLRTALAALQRGGRLAVLFLDLDGFKRVNDAHGHAAGDAVLVEVAERLTRAVRPEDTVGRMGGDEFVLLLSPDGDADLEAVVTGVCDRARAAIAEPVRHGGLDHRVSVSIGVAYARAGDDADAVLRDADSAMYRAKSSGKDRVAVFDPEQQADVLHRAAVERRLRAAVEAREVDVHFQPLVRAATGVVVGAEALLRVPDGAGHHLATEEVVSVAEESGLIREVGHQVLHLACARAAGWDPALRVSVNVSARELAFPDFHGRVTQVLAETGLAASRLVLELTETVLLEAARSTVRDLERLRALGVGIAIDDFGTGYASMRYLAALPVTSVKVDRSFTAAIDRDPVSRTLVQATIGLARDLGLECVVEGVETAGQLEAVGTAPHVIVQGFLLGRPRPAVDDDPALVALSPR